MTPRNLLIRKHREKSRSAARFSHAGCRRFDPGCPLQLIPALRRLDALLGFSPERLFAREFKKEFKQDGRGRSRRLRMSDKSFVSRLGANAPKRGISSQGGCRGFDPRFPLHTDRHTRRELGAHLRSAPERRLECRVAVRLPRRTNTRLFISVAQARSGASPPSSPDQRESRPSSFASCGLGAP